MRTLRIVSVVVCVVGCCATLGVLSPGGVQAEAPAGTMALKARARVPEAPGGDRYVIKERTLQWAPGKTALIIVDMWNKHWCKGATRRVVEMAPRMNRLVTNARDRGVLIVHAPSGCMKAYEGRPARQRARSAPRAANLPDGIGNWCNGIESEKKGVWPVDQSDGGCDCDPRCPSGSPWRSQIDTIVIDDRDAISDSGVEIWNLFEDRGIENVMILGVHTNMCVIGRPFGLRNMARFGKNVVLVWDLTDTMYNSRAWPHVSHFFGTDLVVEHIEKFVCPTITSNELLGGEPFRFKNDVRPKVVFILAEGLYKTQETMPRFAREVLEARHGLRTAVLPPDPDNRHLIPGLAEALNGADLLVLSARRRALPEGDMAALRRHLTSGKPLVALRTSSHAFDTRGRAPSGHAEWRGFDTDVLGCHYGGHYASGPKATIRVADGAGDHPILKGAQAPFTSNGSLYRSSPLEPTAKALLIGSIPDKEPEPVAWVNTYRGGRVFYTSLGHPDDFSSPAFVRLLANAALWALGREGPTPPPGKDR